MEKNGGGMKKRKHINENDFKKRIINRKDIIKQEPTDKCTKIDFLMLLID